jgi:hypothetical protein
MSNLSCDRIADPSSPRKAKHSDDIAIYRNERNKEGIQSVN